jgi:hypothetical protein
MDEPRAVSLQMSRFFVIFYALMFFVLFGFTEEVQGPYRNVLRALVKKFGKGTTLLREACSRRKIPFGSHVFSSSMEKSEPTLPVSIHDKLPSRHDVMVSFAPNLTPNNASTAESFTTLAEKQELAYPSVELTSDIGSLPTTPSSSHRTAPNSPAYYSFPPTPTFPELVVGEADNSKGTWISDWSFPSNINV